MVTFSRIPLALLWLAGGDKLNHITRILIRDIAGQPGVSLFGKAPSSGRDKSQYIREGIYVVKLFCELNYSKLA